MVLPPNAGVPKGVVVARSTTARPTAPNALVAADAVKAPALTFQDPSGGSAQLQVTLGKANSDEGRHMMFMVAPWNSVSWWLARRYRRRGDRTAHSDESHNPGRTQSPGCSPGQVCCRRRGGGVGRQVKDQCTLNTAVIGRVSLVSVGGTRG